MNLLSCHTARLRPHSSLYSRYPAQILRHHKKKNVEGKRTMGLIRTWGEMRSMCSMRSNRFNVFKRQEYDVFRRYGAGARPRPQQSDSSGAGADSHARVERQDSAARGFAAQVRHICAERSVVCKSKKWRMSKFLWVWKGGRFFGIVRISESASAIFDS